MTYLETMRARPELGASPHINTLLVGPGKAGKTTGALSALRGNCLALNFDQPNSTYFARTFRDPGGNIGEPEMPAYAEGKHVTEDLLNEVAIAFSGDAKMPPFATVVADPIGQLHRRLLEDIS